MSDRVRVEVITVLDSPHIRCTVTADLHGEIEFSDVKAGRWTSTALTREQLVKLGEGALTAVDIIDRRRANAQHRREL